MSTTNRLDKIEHIVVLMLENRSFDHMLGFLYQDSNNISPLGHPFEGLTGQESNPDKNGNAVPVYKIKADDPNAYFMPGADPGEGYFNTNSQLFSNHIAPDPMVSATNQGFVKNYAYTLDWESKAGWSILPDTQSSYIMGMFTPDMLPILSTLAKSYAVCDHWYCSVPTETLPNRAFTVMGTSQGKLNDKDKIYTAPTIYNSLSNAGYSWRIYGYDAPPLSRASYTQITHASDDHFGEFDDFQHAAAAGKLANYTFLEPQWGKGGNSQHPNYDVAKGESFIKAVYEAVRHSPLWEKTLLIITYDEHGGCYDHVAPPENATPPDNNTGMYGFDFKRFGVRVPTVLISPYIAAGTVYRVAENTTPLDHTSILKTLEQRFGLQPLTARDAAAQPIGDVLTLDTARSDNPLAHVTAPVSKAGVPHDDQPDHLQYLYAHSMHNLPYEEWSYTKSTDELPEFHNSHEAIEYGRKRYHDYYRHYWHWQHR